MKRKAPVNVFEEFHFRILIDEPFSPIIPKAYSIPSYSFFQGWSTRDPRTNTMLEPSSSEESDEESVAVTHNKPSNGNVSTGIGGAGGGQKNSATLAVPAGQDRYV